MGYWEWLDNIDKSLFLFLHADLAAPELDFFFKGLRNSITWLPFYGFVLFWIIRYYPKQAFQFILLTVFTVAITDFTSASIMKPLFARGRPCFDADLKTELRNLVNCGGFNSFPSSHASNHTGMATFWFWSIFMLNGRKLHWLFLWAAAIGYAQVYVGKHYPFDVVVGSVLGWCVGIVTSKLFERWCFRTDERYKPSTM
ncbi:MAG: phosphatase PAP2 family protein [Chitinophagaceae bacterium]|nr:phosphatase PAP2 family protein [Chitinophagaceae bacterium]